MAWFWSVQGVFGSIRFPYQPVSFVQHEQRPKHVFRRSSLIDSVVQHFLSQLKRTVLSLPLAFNTSNALVHLN